MDKLRILHIGNGKAFKIKAIVTFFRDQGHEIHFVPIPPTEERWAGITYHHLENNSWSSKIRVLKNMLAIRKLVNEIKPDIVHAHNARGPGWYGAFCGYHPFVIHSYGSDIMPFYYHRKDLFSKLMTMFTLRRSDKVIVTGEHMVEASRHLMVPQTKMRVLPRGVDVHRFRPYLDTSDLGKELGLEDSSPVILSPRYQISESLYNIDTVIESMPQVIKSFPKAMFIQLYDESMKESREVLERLAERLGVSRNLKMVKAVDNEQMPYFYNLADVVVSVPSTDGFPVTVLEASSCGIPLIVTKLSYTAEWFIDGENGILIPEREPGTLANAILGLIKDIPLQQKIRAKNRRLVEQKANYEHCMKELETLYRGLLSQRTKSLTRVL